MKPAGFVLVLLVLILSVSPCCQQEDACCEEAVATNAGNHHERDGMAKQPCSPFYSCGSCTGFTTTPAVFILTFYSVEEIQHHTLYVAHSRQTVTFLLRRPPRLV